VLSEEESFLLVYSSSSLLPRDKMTPALSQGYMYISFQSFCSLEQGHWGKIVIKKLTISIDLPTPFEASLSRPGSTLRIQITSRRRMESTSQLRRFFGTGNEELRT